MKISKACAIFENIDSPDFTELEKGEAIYEVLKMPTHKVTDGTGSKSNKTSDTVAQTVIERDKLQKDIEYLEQRLQAVEGYISQCDEIMRV